MSTLSKKKTNPNTDLSLCCVIVEELMVGSCLDHIIKTKSESGMIKQHQSRKKVSTNHFKGT